MYNFTLHLFVRISLHYFSSFSCSELQGNISIEFVVMSIRNGQVRWAFDSLNWRPSLIDLESAVACVQPEEKSRLAKFVFRDDFNASLIGRLLMRRFVKVCLPETDYAAIRFERDERGKPFLVNEVPNHLQIDFNVSHHEKYTVIAGTISENSSEKCRIGVDVMNSEYSGGKPLSEFFRLMRRTFTSNEWNFIEAQSNERMKAAAFMRHWCLKESYVKNIGVGITINLQSIDFHLADAKPLSKSTVRRDTKVNFDDIRQDNWFFEESLLDDDHSVAVAIKNPPESYHEINDNDLLFDVIDFETLMCDAKQLIDCDTEYCRKILAKEWKNK